LFKDDTLQFLVDHLYTPERPALLAKHHGSKSHHFDWRFGTQQRDT